MAFPPQYYHSHYNFSNESPQLLTAAIQGDGRGRGLVMWGEENPHLFDSGGTSSFSSLSTYMSFPERLGVSDMALPEYGIDFRYGVVSDHHNSTNKWVTLNLNGIEGKTSVQEESTMKIGRYSVEERKDKILKYLKKRNQRNFNKTIKYACRKTLADKRIRVRGRFAKNSKEPDEGDNDVSCNTNNIQKQEDIFYSDDFKIKDDDEDWLHAAMASFIYLPYISG